MMHVDGGNTGSVDFPGPKGNNTTVTSYAAPLGVILLDTKGRFTTGGVTSTGFVLNAIDPTTFETLATWTPPANQTLIFTYMQMTLVESQIVVPTKQGHIFVVSRDNTVDPPVFATLRDVDLSSFLLSGEQLLNSMYDSNLNIWFTTGGIIGAGDAPQDSTTLGYVTPSNDVYVNHIPNQMVENGIAINNDTIFVVTGPSGTANHTNASGYMYAFQQGQNEPITWPRIPRHHG